MKIALSTALLVLELTGLSLGYSKAPRDVLEQFCESDAGGGQLTPEGWRKMSSLFVTPREQRIKKVVVVKDFVLSRPLLQKGQAEFYVEYIHLGRIDLVSGRFFRSPSLKERAGFDLVLTSENFGSQSGATPNGTKVVPEWRIKGSPPEPHLTVEAAIRYMTEFRSRTSDSATKRNAAMAITVLSALSRRLASDPRVGVK